jgi:hypothetical protein
MTTERIYRIVTQEDIYAPAQFRWQACWNDFDIDVDVGNGSSEYEAVYALIDMFKMPKPQKENTL